MAALSFSTPLLMDGATGSRLAGLGLACCEQANLTHAGRVRSLHLGYVAAGARVLLTNTFQANPPALSRHGLEGQLERIASRAVQLARVPLSPLVLGDVGPILTPGSRREFADRDALRRTVEALAEADGVLFETCSSPDALAAIAFVLHRVHEVDGLPLLLSLAYHRGPDGKLVTVSGHAPEVFARHATRHGVAALGVNCGRDVGLEDVKEVLWRYRSETDLPLFARPNAGTPDASGAYPRSPAEFSAAVPALLLAGASMLGGCCGTTEAHIGSMQGGLAGLPPG
ncbi:MAG: homocysteine S-methyltransferase family protein [Gemmataceae bacterium]